MVGLLQLALQALGHLVDGVVDGGAGPAGLDDHRPDGEGRILGAAQAGSRRTAPAMITAIMQ